MPQYPEQFPATSQNIAIDNVVTTYISTALKVTYITEEILLHISNPQQKHDVLYLRRVLKLCISTYICLPIQRLHENPLIYA